MGSFLRDTLRQAFAREWWLPGLVLAIILTASNMVILSAKPVEGASPDASFAVAAFVRLAGLVFLTVMLLRRATNSSRPSLMPDGAFWLYLLLGMVGFALAAGLRLILPGDSASLTVLIASNALGGVLTAPLAPWLTAVAVERPLAINPAPRLRRFSNWLPPLIVWQLVIVLPLGALHAFIDIGLLEGDIARSLWLELVDGALSTLIALVSLALAVTAYRRVLRD